MSNNRTQEKSVDYNSKDCPSTKAAKPTSSNEDNSKIESHHKNILLETPVPATDPSVTPGRQNVSVKVSVLPIPLYLQVLHCANSIPFTAEEPQKATNIALQMSSALPGHDPISSKKRKHSGAHGSETPAKKAKRANDEVAGKGHVAQEVAADGATAKRRVNAKIARTPLLDLKALKDVISSMKKRPRPEQDEGPSEHVKFRAKLDIEQVTCAIAAVTEAITVEPENQSSFSLVSAVNLQTAKRTSAEDWSRAIRPGSTLMFPWTYNHAELLKASGAHVPNYEAEYLKCENWAHTFLVLVWLGVGPLRLPLLQFYDSLPGFWEERKEDWRLTQSHIRRTTANLALGILGPPPISNGSVLTGVTMPFEIANNAHGQTATQYGGWECGLHTVLNAWALALDLVIDPKCCLDEPALRLAVDVVNLVLDGHATCPLISGLLITIGFVKKYSNPNHRYFSGSLRDVHKIFGSTGLNNRITDFRNKEIETLDFLIKYAKYQEGPPKHYGPVPETWKAAR